MRRVWKVDSAERRCWRASVVSVSLGGASPWISTSGSGFGAGLLRFRFLEDVGWELRESLLGRKTLGALESSRPMIPLPEQLGSNSNAPTLHQGSS